MAGPLVAELSKGRDSGSRKVEDMLTGALLEQQVSPHHSPDKPAGSQLKDKRLWVSFGPISGATRAAAFTFFESASSEMRMTIKKSSTVTQKNKHTHTHTHDCPGVELVQ